MDVLEKEAVEDLFRFTLLLTGCRERALALVFEALAAGQGRASQLRSASARWIWTARWAWDWWRKHAMQQLPYGDDVQGELRLFFEPLSPGQRAALALRAQSHWEVAEMAQVLRLRPRELRRMLTAMHENRQSQGLSDVTLRDGVAALCPTAEELARLRAMWNAAEGMGKERSVKREEEGELQERLRTSSKAVFRWERILGLSAVGFGVVFTASFLGWEEWRHGERAQVSEVASHLLELNESSSRAEFEPVDGARENLSDWLYLRGMESVNISAPFDRMRVVLGRVTTWRGKELAQFLSENPRAVLWVMERPRREDGRESTAALRSSEVMAAGWSGQWRVSGRYLILFAVPGDAEALEAALAVLGSDAGKGRQTE